MSLRFLAWILKRWFPPCIEKVVFVVHMVSHRNNLTLQSPNTWYSIFPPVQPHAWRCSILILSFSTRFPLAISIDPLSQNRLAGPKLITFLWFLKMEPVSRNSHVVPESNAFLWISYPFDPSSHNRLVGLRRLLSPPKTFYGHLYANF